MMRHYNVMAPKKTVPNVGAAGGAASAAGGADSDSDDEKE